MEFAYIGQSYFNWVRKDNLGGNLGNLENDA